MGKGRAPCCDKTKVKRGPWSPEEDLKLINFVQQHGHANWRALPAQAGLLRCGKSCRLRWINYLRPDVKRGSLTPEEEETIIKLHQTYGNKWSKIASHMPGRTDNEIKNVFNTHLQKRLLQHHQHPDDISYSTPTTSSCTSAAPVPKKRKKSPKEVKPNINTTYVALTGPFSPTEVSSSSLTYHSGKATPNMTTSPLSTGVKSLEQQQIKTLSPSTSCVSNASIHDQSANVDQGATVCDPIPLQETTSMLLGNIDDQLGYFYDKQFWDGLELDNLCTIQGMDGVPDHHYIVNQEDNNGTSFGDGTRRIGGEWINNNDTNNNARELSDWLAYLENVLGLDEDK